MQNGHPDIREVLKATREQLALPEHVSVPDPTQYEHATAILTGQEIDKALEPSEECIRSPLSAGFRQQVAGRSTKPLEHSCQTPPSASKSGRGFSSRSRAGDFAGAGDSPACDLG